MSPHYLLNSQASFARTRTFFYPIGNTPAQNLAEFSQPNQDVDLLLLGCGDVRHILCTAYYWSTLTASGTLSFVACDWEPGILARHVFLFTLLIEYSRDAAGDQVWAVYYDFQVDSTTLNLIHTHTSRLLAFESYGQWLDSQYAILINFINADSFHRTRAIWARYLLYDVDHRPLAHGIRQGKPGGQPSLRNAGPFALKHGQEGIKLFSQYWSTGVTGGGKPEHCHGNPLFLSEMSDRFEPHHGTEPSLAFQVAAAYRDKSPNVPHFIRGEFWKWCTAFQTLAKTRQVSLKYVAAEAVDFCNVLACRHEVPHFSQHNRLVPLHLDITIPKVFDSIHTSNLCDHVGMLNILVATSSLLCPKSTLYTETIIQEMGTNPSDFLSGQLFGDDFSVGILLGLLPISRITPLTTSDFSRVFEANASDSAGLVGIAWKNPALGDPLVDSPPQIAVNEQEISHFLMAIYRQMMSRENHSNIFRGGMTNLLAHHQTTRHGFALLVRRITHRLSMSATALSAIAVNLVDLIFKDRTLMLGSNGYQELLMHFHLLGLHSEGPFSLSIPRQVFSEPGTPWKCHTHPGILSQVTLPAAVRLVLVVPRKSLRPLEEEGNPNLIGNIWIDGRAHNIFGALHIAFGKKTAVGSSHINAIYCEDFDVEPEDGERAWRGQYDLIASFDCPTWVLHCSRHIQVGISVPTPNPKLISKLGLRMVVFQAALDAREHVSILTQSQGGKDLSKKPILCLSPSQRLPHNTINPSSDFQVSPVTVCFDQSSKISHYQTTISFHSDDLKLALANAKISFLQQSSTTITVVIDSRNLYRLIFPSPVIGKTVRLRVARKSAYIEVLVSPNRGAPQMGEYCNHLFPVSAPDEAGVLSLWSLPRIPLDHLPPIDKSTSQEWIFPLLGSMFSFRERELSNTSHGNAVLSLKQSLNILFQVGEAVFGLTMPESGGVQIVIFVDAVRLDPLGQTVVADCTTCVLTPAIVDNPARFAAMTKAVEKEAGKLGFRQIIVTPAELKLWKVMLTAAQERSRVDWHHRETCEYREYGIPLSLEEKETPFCSCGLGKVSSHFVKRHHAMVPYCTRLVISPVFSTWYVEKAFDPFQMGKHENAGKETRKMDKTVGGNVQKAGVQQATSPSPTCANCGKTGDLRCARCHVVRYCGRECQKRDWPQHKAQCKLKVLKDA